MSFRAGWSRALENTINPGAEIEFPAGSVTTVELDV